MQYKKFTEYEAALKSCNKISLRANESVFIKNAILKMASVEVIEEFELGAELFWNPNDRGMVGISIRNIDEASWIRVVKEKGGVSLCIAPILRFLGIEKNWKHFKFDYSIEDKLIIIDFSSLLKKGDKKHGLPTP